MSVPSRREVLTWYSAIEPYGLTDPQSMLAATLFVDRANRSQYPVRFVFGPDSIFCRTSVSGMRRTLQRLADAGWLSLASNTTDSVLAELAIPPELVPVEFPGKWEARRVATV